MRLRRCQADVQPAGDLLVTEPGPDQFGSLPLAFYSGFLLERKYELSKETLGGWLADQAKAFGIGVLLASVAAEIVYAFIRLSPDRWWLTAGVTFRLPRATWLGPRVPAAPATPVGAGMWSA